MRWTIPAITLLLSQTTVASAQEPTDGSGDAQPAAAIVEAAEPRLAVGPFDMELCTPCTSSTWTIQAPEGPVQVLVVRGRNVSNGENAGHSFVSFSWYSHGVGDGADGSLSAEAVRDLVGDSIAASSGAADRLSAAGTMLIGSDTVNAMAVTLGAGLTARVGAVAEGDGVLVVTAFVRASEPSVAGLTRMLETVTIQSSPTESL